MSDKKLRIIYDATVLGRGKYNSTGRSGIFFTALNLLKEFIKKSDVEISLYCNPNEYFCLCNVLNKEFKNYQFDILTNRFALLYAKLRTKKIELKDSRKQIQKFFVQLIMLPFTLLNKMFLSLNYLYLLETKKFDAFLSPIYKIPNGVKCKKYTVLYDLIPLILPEYRGEKFKKGYWLYDLCQTLNEKDYYFAISDWTRNDFLKYYPTINPNHIKTTLLACDEKYRCVDSETIAKIKQKYNIPVDKKYIFSLCNLVPHKNLIRSVKTFIQFLKKNNIDNMYFAFGGARVNSLISEVEQSLMDIDNCKDKILKLGYVDDEDIAALYSGAEWFVYTSRYEGFGLPPLEAMSCGCPVITSNCTSIPEVVGDAAITIDWDSDEQHIEAYEKYYFNPELREEYRQKGLERAKLFSWTKCVNQMIEAMKGNI